MVIVDDNYLTAEAATVRQRLKMAGVRIPVVDLFPGGGWSLNPKKRTH